MGVVTKKWGTGVNTNMKKVLEIRGLIHSKFDSESKFAEHLKWHRQRLNKITTGKKKPDLDETFAIAEGLEMNFEEVAQIFLRYWSSNGQRGEAFPPENCFEIDASVPPEKCFEQTAQPAASMGSAD